MSRKDARIEKKKRKWKSFITLTEQVKDVIEEKADKKSKGDMNNKNIDMEPPLKKTKEDDKPLDEFAALRKAYRANRKKIMQKPKFFLKLDEDSEKNIPEKTEETEYSDVAKAHKNELHMLDVQKLLLYSFQGGEVSYRPRWCELLRWKFVQQVLVLVLEHVSRQDYLKHEECFPFISENFPKNVPIVNPAFYEGTTTKDLFTVPLSGTQLLKQQMKDLEKEREMASEHKQVKESKSKEKNGKETTELPFTKCSSNYLLLSPDQMITANYPMPTGDSEKYEGFVCTQDTYKEATASSPLYAVDCEMCLTTAMKHELTRVSLVDEAGNVLYDSLVKPHNKIINYLTKYSGVTAKMLKDVETRLKDVQSAFRDLLPPDAVLCGHSVENDLIALKLFHPYIIDTSVLYNLTGKRHAKPSLRNLSFCYLGKKIQQGDDGHDSTEDAKATMDLVLLKLYKGLEYGDAVLGAITFPKPEDIAEFNTWKKTNLVKVDNYVAKTGEEKSSAFYRPSNHSESLFSITERYKKKVSLVGSEEKLGMYKDEAVTYCEATSNDEFKRYMAEAVDDSFLVYGMLTAEDHCEEEKRKQKCYRKMDKYVRKMMKSVKPDTLTVVLMTNADQKSKAMCFVKLTEEIITPHRAT